MTTTLARLGRSIPAVVYLWTGTLLAQLPRIDSINPPQVPIAGGTQVIVRGANFGGATVTLNSIALTPM
jgi:hypothetical protein